MIARTVLQLNSICKRATFDFAMVVGELIIQNFYGGDLDTWRARGPKDMSFRRLSKHPDLPMSPTALFRSVAIFELALRTGLRDWRHVSTSHIRLVLPLPPSEQAPLLRVAEFERWSVNRLQQEIDGRYGHAPASRRGRKKRSPLRAVVHGIQQSVNATDALSDTPHLDNPSPESARLLIEALERVRGVCENLERRIRPHLSDIEIPPVA